MSRLLALPLLLLCFAASAAPAATLDRVRRDHVLRCGGAIRPGLAFPATDHSWLGLEVDLCQAIAVAVAGEGARIDFHGYGNDSGFARAGRDDDIAFLTGSELFTHALIGAVLPGPAIYYETTRIIVWSDNKALHVSDLRDTMICAEPGTGAERNLQAYMPAHGLPFRFSGWQEVEEEMDAFAVGRCPAVAGEATALAALRYGAEAHDRKTRLLPEALATVPVLAVTPAADPAWFATVSWAVETVLATGNTASVQGPPLPAAFLAASPGDGVGEAARLRLLKAVGSYGSLFESNLGSGSPLGLAPGPNAPWSEGGLFAPAVVE